jgi:hypothetical protein
MVPRRSLLLATPALILPHRRALATSARDLLLFGAQGPSLSANFLSIAGTTPPSGTINVGPNCPPITFTRASTATSLLYTATSGSFTSYSSGVARLLSNGLLVEPQSTNFFLNSGSPATQTVTLIAGTYTVWSVGTGSVATVAGTATGTGFGTASQGTPNTFTLTVGGTVVSTVTGTVLVFQLEPLAFPTSYIPTSGSAATRAADSATLATGSWFNPQNYGTMAATCVVPALSSATVVLFELDNGTTTHFWQVDLLGTGNAYARLSSSTSYFTANTTGANTVFGIGSVLTPNSIAVSLNGGAIVQGSGVPFSPFTRLNLSPGGSYYLQTFQYWPRALNAAQFRGATAP